MAYERYCASCTYLNERDWCERKGRTAYGSDERCYDWCEAYGRSNSARQNLYERSNGTSGCYLTTIMCNILGFKDNNYYLNVLRGFRDNVMRFNPKYIPMLVTYDVYGPIIAKELANDKNNVQIAMAMFDNYITKSVDAIKEEKYELATNIYIAMTKTLADSYNIPIMEVEYDESKLDKETLGHGKVRRLIPETK